MHDDNPLWYDYLEAGEEPGPVLSELASTFVGLAVAVAAVKQVYLLPDRLWLAAIGEKR